MYDVTINNNFVHAIRVDGCEELAPGGQYQFYEWGSHTVSVPGMGDINFIDLGEKKLDPYTNDKIPWTKSTWGGLIRYRGLDAYFRYEDEGYVEVTIDSIGSINIRFSQGGMAINLADLTVS